MSGRDFDAKRILTSIFTLFFLQYGCAIVDSGRLRYESAQKQLKESRKKADESALKRLDKATTNEFLYYDCMIMYAGNNYTVKMSGMEIAEAGIAACESYLREYESNMYWYHDIRETSKMNSLNEVNYYTNIARIKTRDDVVKVTENGKRQLLSVLVEKMKPTQ